MITIKLNRLAERLGKNITEIAEETGLNRNAVTALFHNKVDGIRFSTLEKICTTYGVGILDVIEMDVPAARQTGPLAKPYKQEGSIVPFTCWPWVIAINHPDKAWFTTHFNQISTYFSGDYGMGYWDMQNMHAVAQAAYARYKDPKEFDRLFQRYKAPAGAIEALYLSTEDSQLLSGSIDDVSWFMKNLWQLYGDFWTYSLFIDSFDAGFDHEETARIAAEHSLTLEEIGILTTPQQLTFNNERQLALLEIVKSLKGARRLTGETLRIRLQDDPQVKDYMKRFDYHTSSYAHITHIALDDVVTEIERYLGDRKLLDAEYTRLTDYGKDTKERVRTVLKRHRLKENPLEFFARLTYWREHRKQINLMGIHLLDLVLRAIEQTSGIPYKYLQYLSYEEVEGAAKGLVTKDVLKKRREQGMMVICKEGDYKIIDGAEASSLQEELEQLIHADKPISLDLHGNVASQGYARGIAKIVMDQNDFHKIEEGDILVTGMTRPEFVPIMQKAAAIVTNEGGITCHAAIVSRELGKPCIIGTKNATSVINDGDLVEVRANHGTVRILR